MGLNTKRWPQAVVLGITITLLGVNSLSELSAVTLVLNGFSLLWLLYVFVHLGISFILAALIATPGCEMRAIPHAYSLLTGRQYREHFCPGFLDRVDKWERGFW
ncbi:hypothetical protein [Kangiella shandongensis]|uniref:hypothetical protein n=1 Tax=Kangiella shandongensis TaxID=2763258 RepID=UPI001CC03352|nr:hypothetical protein [Kangiella shandongensis]